MSRVTASSSSSSSGLPPPHGSKRPSPALQPITAPALSPSLAPLAPPQPKQPRKRAKPSTTTTSPPVPSPPSPSHPLRHPPSSANPPAQLPPPPPTTYHCYLLRSLSLRHRGHTYIGFTTDPLRRLRQHNGQLTSGAHRTARRRPWQLVAAIAGFPSKVTALQFEWQWTYPRKSKRMRAVVAARRWGGGVRGKVELLYELLATQPWRSMPLQVRYAEEDGWGVHETVMRRSDRESKEWEKVQGRLVDDEERKVERMRRHMYALPVHMPLTVGPFEELDMYAYRRLRRERRKGRVDAGGVAGVTPGEDAESDTEDGTLEDDGAMVSGEESENSGESDVEIIEQPDHDDDNWTSYPLTQPAQPNPVSSLSSSSRPLSSSPVLSSSALSRSLSSGQLRCGLCFRRSEVDEGGHGAFFSGCDQCRFVGHLTCIVQHIFKQMQMEECKANEQQHSDFLLTQPTAANRPSTASAHSPPARSASNPADLFSPSPAFPPTIFSPLPSSLPLLPPPSTGTCPTCSARLSYPLLIDRCRHLHVGRGGRRGGDVWYEEADELSMGRMVREYAGRAGELKAKVREEEAQKKKEDGVHKRKRKGKPAAPIADSGNESNCSTDTSQPSPKRKRKPATPNKKRKAAKPTTSPPDALSLPPLLAAAPSDGERDKENVDGGVGRAGGESSAKRKPTASRRVAMHDRGAAPPLFASSQPAPAPAAVAPSTVSSWPAVSLSDDDDVLLVDELPSADKRRMLIAEAAERRLGRAGSPCGDSKPYTEHAAAAASDVALLAVKGSGGLHAAEVSSDVFADRDYVQVDDDDDSVLALDTEAEDEVSGMSLSERLKARAASAQLMDSLQDIR